MPKYVIYCLQHPTTELLRVPAPEALPARVPIYIQPCPDCLAQEGATCYDDGVLHGDEAGYKRGYEDGLAAAIATSEGAADA